MILLWSARSLSRIKMNFFTRILNQCGHQFDRFFGIKCVVNDQPAGLPLVGHRGDHRALLTGAAHIRVATCKRSRDPSCFGILSAGALFGARVFSLSGPTEPQTSVFNCMLVPDETTVWYFECCRNTAIPRSAPDRAVLTAFVVVRNKVAKIQKSHEKEILIRLNNLYGFFQSEADHSTHLATLRFLLCSNISLNQ
jgi:hypothetical protein